MNVWTDFFGLFCSFLPSFVSIRYVHSQRVIGVSQSIVLIIILWYCDYSCKYPLYKMYPFIFNSILTDCGQPDRNPGTTVSVSGTKLGDIAIYRCARGFRSFSGSQRRTCGSGGQWSGAAPSCTKIGKYVWKLQCLLVILNIRGVLGEQGYLWNKMYIVVRPLVELECNVNMCHQLTTTKLLL